MRRRSVGVLIQVSQRSRSGIACRWYSASASTAAKASLWGHLEKAPLDSNHETNDAFEKDPSPLKVNLGRGVYKDDNGKNWVLPCVREAEKRLYAEGLNHDYLPFKGWDIFTKHTAEFAFGKDSPHIQNKKVATVQAISGTGALRVGAEFLARFLPETKDASRHIPRPLYLPDPSYVNHVPIFVNNSFQIKRYRYYDPKTCGLDFEGMLADIKAAPPRSVFLLHACAHNPTGVDPTLEQWKKFADAFGEKDHVAFFDCAYQGFASGDPDFDSAAFRYFTDQGNHVLVAQSYAKNFGLYGQRVGALNIVTTSAEETEKVMSQLNQVIRPMYSNPPGFGARIVGSVFKTPDLSAQWRVDVKTMADRINGARQTLVSQLKKIGSKRDWSHIAKQIGMFAYSGLSEAEVKKLRGMHVYMNYDGRMSISGINSKNVAYLAECMHKATW